jgi:hypothetical protein
MSRAEALILDGGVLTEWLACRYEAADRSWRFGHFQKHALRTPTDVASFENLLKRYPNRLYMSAYAIAEVQRHARDTEDRSDPNHAERSGLASTSPSRGFPFTSSMYRGSISIDHSSLNSDPPMQASSRSLKSSRVRACDHASPRWIVDYVSGVTTWK